MDFDRLQELNQEFSADVTAADLEPKRAYTINGFLERQTPYGRGVKVLLEVGQMFLPRRFAEFFTEEVIEDVRANYIGELYLIISDFVHINGRDCPVMEIRRYSEDDIINEEENVDEYIMEG